MPVEVGDIVIWLKAPGHAGMVYEVTRAGDDSTAKVIHARLSTDFAIESNTTDKDGKISHLLGGAWIFRPPWAQCSQDKARAQLRLREFAYRIHQSAKYGIGRAVRLYIGDSTFGDEARERLGKYRLRGAVIDKKQELFAQAKEAAAQARRNSLELRSRDAVVTRSRTGFTPGNNTNTNNNATTTNNINTTSTTTATATAAPSNNINDSSNIVPDSRLAAPFQPTQSTTPKAAKLMGSWDSKHSTGNSPSTINNNNNNSNNNSNSNSNSNSKSKSNSNSNNNTNNNSSSSSSSSSSDDGTDPFVRTITCSEAVILCYQLTFAEGNSPFFILLDAAHTMPGTLKTWLEKHWEIVQKP